jgi:large subunit ribosomal protein L35
VPKIKTHKSTSKRFRRTKGGKAKLTQTKITGKRRKKSRRVRALYGEKILVESVGVKKRVQKLAPYLKEKS